MSPADDTVQTADAPQSPAPSAPADAFIVVPVRNVVLFPEIVFPITMGRPVSVAAAQAAVREQRQVLIVLQKDPSVDAPGPADLHAVGTVANVLRYITAPDGAHHLVCQGVQRFRITEFVPGFPYLVARGLHLPEPTGTSADIEARFLLLRQQSLEVLQLVPQTPPELRAAVESITSAAALADLAAAYMDISTPEKQEVLETVDLVARLTRVSSFLAHRLEVLRLSAEIGQATKASIDERQREALLREQMATIQKQLGEDGGNAQEIADLEKAIGGAGMSEEVETQARKELRRLQRMPDASAEYGMIRTYLDWLIELPWKLPETPPIDIAEARRILDADHFGLEKIKTRITEYLAVRKLAPEGKAPILCFVGPPGVGKTSLGQSIAKAMGRPFVRTSLGGLHDEAEIRGHRRTYVGALPGSIIQAIRKAGSRSCLMMLDELDKMGVGGFQGDPASAMLEVLDPEQNNSFRDNYLAVPFDLSRVVFIATANVLDSIPGPLRDRMEIITLAGYTAEEKQQIALRYLVRRQLEANGLTPAQANLAPEAVTDIIQNYTREAGVRNLEREIGRALRHAAVQIADGSASKVEIGRKELAEILGPPRFENEVAMRTATAGVATGLAWTPVGGDILFIEAARSPGEGRLILTGQLGDVMKESAQAALSLVKSKAPDLGIDPDKFRSEVHVHVPAGATPKDGPSAGVAMFIALASLFTDRKVRSDTAMTGEISLRGLVLPVGGIKEKVVAAAGAGITRVLLPARNRRDYEEIPEEARKKLEFVWLERVEDAVAEALEPAKAQAV
ncbi:MAG: endopeptidase La [Caulobacteraceae bacterium]|nr:endopeptidase La [Caulobacteraceae bacterium]